ncbi:MAG: ATP-binding protein [Chromatiales bacterium]|nr:ATP-binding protein [Chromatiales bacterium]
MISLTSRVTLTGALVLTTFIALTALALEQAFEQSAHSAERERLFAQLYLVMAAAEVSDSGMLAMPGHLPEVRLELPASGLYARIDPPEGESLWHSPSAIGLTLPSPPREIGDGEYFHRLPFNGDNYFLAALAIEWETLDGPLPMVFSVLEDSAGFELQMRNYRHTLWGWLAAMAIIALLALIAALVWGLRPLRTVASEVRAIESGEQEVLSSNYPREVKRLSDNINTLLNHEHAQQLRYRNALGDLAHSLKTPLAVLRALADKVGEHSPTLHEQVDRMDNIVQYQLQRAATAGRSALAAPLPVKPVVERLITTLQKVYHYKSVQLDSSVDDSVLFRGDEGDLMELLGNLLDNAFKWSHSRVVLEVAHEGRVVLIRVADDGPGIPDEQAERVLQRGVRLDEATPGHGIGLPMVRDIVEAYGGSILIEHSPLGGALFRLQLPAG